MQGKNPTPNPKIVPKRFPTEVTSLEESISPWLQQRDKSFHCGITNEKSKPFPGIIGRKNVAVQTRGNQCGIIFFFLNEKDNREGKKKMVHTKHHQHILRMNLVRDILLESLMRSNQSFLISEVNCYIFYCLTTMFLTSYLLGAMKFKVSSGSYNMEKANSNTS